EVGRMHAGLVEGALVVVDIVVGMLQRPGEAPRLQRHDLVARGALGVIEFGTIDVTLRFPACRSHGAFPLEQLFFISFQYRPPAARCREWCGSARGIPRSRSHRR